MVKYGKSQLEKDVDKLKEDSITLHLHSQVMKSDIKNIYSKAPFIERNKSLFVELDRLSKKIGYHKEDIGDLQEAIRRLDRNQRAIVVLFYASIMAVLFCLL